MMNYVERVYPAVECETTRPLYEVGPVTQRYRAVASLDMDNHGPWRDTHAEAVTDLRQALTTEYLGNLSDAEVERAKTLLDAVSEVETRPSGHEDCEYGEFVKGDCDT